MEPFAPVFEGGGTMAGIQQMGSQGTPEQGDGAGPILVWHAFHCPKFDQSQATGGGAGIPEFVEADFAAMVIAAAVGMQMAQGLADQAAVIAIGL